MTNPHTTQTVTTHAADSPRRDQSTQERSTNDGPGYRALAVAALTFVALAALFGWAASFVGLHGYGVQRLFGFTNSTAWFIPLAIDGAAFATSLMTFRASIKGRNSLHGRLLMWAFTASSSWINWIHQVDQEARIVAAGLPIAAVAVFDLVMKELRHDYEQRHGRRAFRLRPGLLLLRYVVDRDGTSSAVRGQITAIPVSSLVGIGTTHQLPAPTESAAAATGHHSPTNAPSALLQEPRYSPRTSSRQESPDQPDHGRDEDTDREDTQIIPVITDPDDLDNGQVTPWSGTGDLVVGHEARYPDQPETAIPTTQDATPARSNSKADQADKAIPHPAQPDHRGRPIPTMLQDQTAASRPDVALAYHHHDHSTTDVETPTPLKGKYGPKLPTRGKAPTTIAQLLTPIANRLAAEQDYLSREDVKELTQITSSQTAGAVLNILRQRHLDRTGQELPQARGRRKPDRERTIRRALADVLGVSPLQAVH